MTKAVVWGLIATAISRGFVAGLGCWWAGVPAPVLMGRSTAVIALLLSQLGTPFAWGSIGAWLLLLRQHRRGIGLLLWGALVVSWVDNLVRPLVISNPPHPAGDVRRARRAGRVRAGRPVPQAGGAGSADGGVARVARRSRVRAPCGDRAPAGARRRWSAAVGPEPPISTRVAPTETSKRAVARREAAQVAIATGSVGTAPGSRRDRDSRRSYRKRRSARSPRRRRRKSRLPHSVGTALVRAGIATRVAPRTETRGRPCARSPGAVSRRIATRVALGTSSARSPRRATRVAIPFPSARRPVLARIATRVAPAEETRGSGAVLARQGVVQRIPATACAWSGWIIGSLLVRFAGLIEADR